MLPFVTDENFNGDIIRGLLFCRPAMDLFRIQDVGLRIADDPTILAWAAQHQRILLTHDRATVPNFAYERVVAGKKMTGVFVFHDRILVREAIDEILLLDDFTDLTEWNGRVVFMPL